MTTKTAAERVAALRDEHARLGDNVDHLTDLDLLNRELERTQRESRRHENAYTSLLQDQVKHDRAVYAAARRAAAEDRIAWAGMYLSHLVAQSAHSINAVINRAAELPDGRIPVEQGRELKAAAERAKWAMSGLVGHRQSQLEEVRQQNAAISLVEKQRQEILRLREFITNLGQRLHAKHGGTNRGRCECSGCELIRAMDDVPAEQATAPTTTSAS
ncbi:hypothetical protein [Streptomyces anthocyanicus]|uniref:hypothetical protein n=1 Tax=Streptomyces anthocyanicus TaxID=68174 RepID=UPI0038705B30|nr:hypothetical protein OH747_05715 [Streptomyces anthocyanicus]